MRRWVFLALSMGSFGCGSDAPTTTSSGAPPAKSTVVATAKPTTTAPMSSASAAAEERRNKLANCPTAAEGAKTEIADVDKGVTVTVTAADTKVVDEIKKRAKIALEHAKAEGVVGQHTGQGKGGGTLGRCPIVLNDTELTTADVDGGVKFTMLAKDEKEVDWLRREARERHAALAEPGADAAGERKMANCPSAVNGATTEVKEAGGNLLVLVTSKDEATTKDIRERAKKLGEALAKAPPTADQKKEHGGGGGGGGLGRCPAALADTTWTSKEIDGGVEMTLKPKDPKKLPDLTKEAKERAGRFPTK